jgi:phosphoesterase RecJ-like protein
MGTITPIPAERPDLADAARLLSGARRVWLGTHREPDGDAIGSLLGLGWLLEERGLAVTLACQDPVPADVAFLPGSERVSHIGPAGHDLAVALDAGDLGRLGSLVDAASWRGQTTLVLDHHISNPGYGDVNVVDAGLASTAELVVALAGTLRLPLSARAATCLLTGIVTDTIGFRTSNTTADTLATAQTLMAAGANLAEITAEVFAQRPLAALRLTGRALERLEVRGSVGLVALTADDFAAVGADRSEARGLSSFLVTARELAAVAVLHEASADGSVDLSMRSKRDVSLLPVAQALGGGGHPQAAGARLGPGLGAAAAQVWAAFETHLAELLAGRRP